MTKLSTCCLIFFGLTMCWFHFYFDKWKQNYSWKKIGIITPFKNYFRDSKPDPYCEVFKQYRNTQRQKLNGLLHFPIPTVFPVPYQSAFLATHLDSHII